MKYTRRRYLEEDEKLNAEVKKDLDTLKAIFDGYNPDEDPENSEGFITDGIPDADQYESDEL